MQMIELASDCHARICLSSLLSARPSTWAPSKSHSFSCVQSLFRRIPTLQKRPRSCENVKLYDVSSFPNGSQRSFVNKCLYQRHTKNNGEQKQRPEIFRVLPYVRSVSEVTEHVLRLLNMCVERRLEAGIPRLLMQRKGRLLPTDRSSFIYHINYLDFPANYFDMTYKRLNTRMYKHT
uniref:Uncharacterized protein n=1 Tax=Schistocephalus solidus TaxID=70667 RepID=A0A0X3P729_SCHSO